MAKKASGGGGKRAPAAAEDGGTPKPGHNLAEIKKKALPALRAVLKLHDEFESVSGEYRSKIKDALEKGANETGVSRKIFKMMTKQIRDAQKLEAHLEELESNERDDLVALQESLSDTPLGVYVGGLLAEVGKPV